MTELEETEKDKARYDSQKCEDNYVAWSKIIRALVKDDYKRTYDRYSYTVTKGFGYTTLKTKKTKLKRYIP